MNIKKFEISEKWYPWLLLGICILAFGLLITELGFYWDDWQVIYLAHTRGVDAYWAFYQYDRPLSAWTYILEVPILGTTPLYWHILTLLLRWLTAWGMYAVLKRIWPGEKVYAFWMAAIFAVYPSFFQQSVAVAYSQHFTTYALYFLSIWLMVRAMQNRRRFWLFTLGGMLTAALHMLTMEYMVGLELIRPAVIWLLLVGKGDALPQKVKKGLLEWLPYLLVWLAFIIWRMFFVVIPDDPNTPQLLYALQENPLRGLIELTQVVLQNLVHVWLTVWGDTIAPQLIDFSSPFTIFSWGIALLSGLALFYLLRKKTEEQNAQSWQGQAVMFGLYATVVGLLPVWVTGRDMFKGFYADRFTLPAMFGASVLLVGLLAWLVGKAWARSAIFALMVGLSIGVHLRTANDFRWDWIRQERFYWQMHWRAPEIEKDTAIITNGVLSRYVGRYVAAFGINTFYDHPLEDLSPSLWYFEYVYEKFHTRMDQILNGANIRGDLRNLAYQQSANHSIVVYKDEPDQCIWFLSPRDQHNTEIPEIMRQLSALSDFGRIHPVPSGRYTIPSNIFDREAEHTWCYYYQKAGLAQQMGDWGAVTGYWQQAKQQGYSPAYGYELLPFIEAYALQQDWGQAVNLTLEAYPISETARPMLCQLWDEIESVPEQTRKEIEAVLAYQK